MNIKTGFFQWFSQKIQILIRNIKYQRINGKNSTDFINVKFQNFWFFKSALHSSDQFWTNILYVHKFFWPNQYKKPVFIFLRNYKEIIPWEVAWKFSFFDLMDLTIWDFWQTPAGVLWGQKLNGSSIGT